MENLLISACLLGIPCRYDGLEKPKIVGETLKRLKEKYNLVPVCPEIYGGLPTPRVESERVGERVIMKNGTDVTENYRRGAEATLRLAKILNCRIAILKERSPSCGHGLIYDGTFSGKLIAGDGVTAQLLTDEGIAVFGESELEKII